MFIKPPYKEIAHNMEGVEGIDYNSTINPLSKTELSDYLIALDLL